MVFGGGILGGARKIWGNPYLNSMTVLFDRIVLPYIALFKGPHDNRGVILDDLDF